jgi:hypothetical protein
LIGPKEVRLILLGKLREMPLAISSIQVASTHAIDDRVPRIGGMGVPNPDIVASEVSKGFLGVFLREASLLSYS